MVVNFSYLFTATREKMAEKMISKKNSKEDVVLGIIDEELGKKSKGKKCSSSGSAKAGPSKSTSVSNCNSAAMSNTNKTGMTGDTRSTGNDSEMMTVLKAIQENQTKQNDKLNNLSDKVNELYEYDGNENEYEIEEEEENEPPTKKQKTDDNNNQNNDSDKFEQSNSRFSTMSKRFKQKEITGEKIDDTLASNITDFFRNGMDEVQYNELMKDDTNSRPDNCDGLVVVKTNQLIWDLISPYTQTCDRKMQNIEKSVVKAATLLAKMVNDLAKLEKEKNTDEFNETIESCNDVLAVLGHTNRQINLTRRDFIRTELNNEYTHLCAQSQPYTTFLFGDDVSKVAKDIEDCSKIANRIHFGRGGNRYPMSRGRHLRGSGRGRFIRGRGTGRGRGAGRNAPDNQSRASGQDSSYESGPKNYPRRGGGRGYRK